MLFLGANPRLWTSGFKVAKKRFGRMGAIGRVAAPAVVVFEERGEESFLFEKPNKEQACWN